MGDASVCVTTGGRHAVGAPWITGEAGKFLNFIMLRMGRETGPDAKSDRKMPGGGLEESLWKMAGRGNLPGGARRLSPNFTAPFMPKRFPQCVRTRGKEAQAG